MLEGDENYEKNKAGSAEVGGELQVNGTLMEGLTEKVPFGQRLEEDEGTCHVRRPVGQLFQAEGTSSCKGPEARLCQA